jgi:hypothetical protein
MTVSLGRPVADFDDFLEVAPDIGLRTAAEPAPEPKRRSFRATWSLMAAAAILTTAGIGYWALRGQPATGTTTAGAAAPVAPPIPTGVPGFAEMFLASYLTRTSAAIDDFLSASPPVTAMTPARRYVTRTATMEVTPVDDDYWRVVVAADVLTFEDGTYHPSGLQYFQVGVVDDGGRLVAVALPARVGGPAPRPAAPRALQVADGTPTAEQTALIGDFLEALLTDRRDIGRYISPDSTIAAISPAPYQAVLVTSAALFGDGTALATVDAQTADGSIDSLQYVIRFSDGAGNPSVADLPAGPPPIGLTGQDDS